MEMLQLMLSTPLILFICIVAPIWIVMHYKSKQNIGQGLNQEQLNQLQGLVQQAEKMRERIQTLESILDAESPKWRDRL